MGWASCVAAVFLLNLVFSAKEESAGYAGYLDKRTIAETKIPIFEASSFPKKMILVDGDAAYLEVMLNCIGSLLKVGVSMHQIWALPYDKETAVLLRGLGVNVLWEPTLLSVAKGNVLANKCEVGAGKRAMDLVMFMKRTLFLKLVISDVSFCSVDSDVVFTENPLYLFDPGTTFGEPVPDAIMYGSRQVSVGSVGHTTTGKKFGVNGSPGWFLNPKKLVPFFQAYLEHGLQLFRGCTWGWGQVGKNQIAAALGVAWKPEPQYGKETFRGVWNTPPNLPKLRGMMTMETLELITPRNISFVAIGMESLPGKHYAGPGGANSKIAHIKKEHRWYVKPDPVRAYNGSILSIFLQPVLDAVANQTTAFFDLRAPMETDQRERDQIGRNTDHSS